MTNGIEKEWDVFISHASEDKDALVRPLAETLTDIGVKVWYDEFTLSPGDSLSRSIDKGLASSKFGIVILSKSFINKPWTEYELRGLVAREIGEDKVIIPIWLGINRQEVLNFSPPLADKIAIVSESMELSDIPIHVLRVVRPDIYHNKKRNELLSVCVRHFPSVKSFDLFVAHELKQIASSILSRSMSMNILVEQTDMPHEIKRRAHFISTDIASFANDLISATNIIGRHDAVLALKTHNNSVLLFAEEEKSKEVEEVDVVELLNVVTHSQRKLVAIKKLQINVEKTIHSLRINAHKRNIRILLENLFSNALKYAESDSVISIRLIMRSYVASVEIENIGPPLEGEDSYYIFRDGYRGSNARAVAGDGKGLFVAKGISEIYGIALEYKSEIIEKARTRHTMICAIPIFLITQRC